MLITHPQKLRFSTPHLGNLHHHSAGKFQHIAGSGGAALAMKVLLHGEEVALHHQTHCLNTVVMLSTSSKSVAWIGPESIAIRIH